jgi:hypothetical protein
MKTAICFYGLVGTTDGKSSEGKGNPRKCFNISVPLYQQHIISPNDIDIFIHSWSIDLKTEILEAYPPKKSLIETQIIFDIPNYVPGNTPRNQTHYSVWYSRQESIRLKSEFEYENNFTYDCVMLARFDLAWQTDLIFSEYNQDYFWVGKWPKKVFRNRMLSDTDYWKQSKGGEITEGFETKWWGYPYNKHGLIGTWFFSNSQDMNRFGTLFNCLDDYSRPKNCPLADGCMSAHMQSLYHIEQLDLLDKLKFCDKNWHDDFPSVRRKYYRNR